MLRGLAAGCCMLASLVSTGFTDSSSPQRAVTGVEAHAAASSKLATGPLETGLVDTNPFLSAEAPLNFARVRAAGTTYVRLIIYWRLLGLTDATRPPGFNAQNPADPAYLWSAVDRQVSLAVASGLQPILVIQQAPAWAERQTQGDVGTRRPNPQDLAEFARAAAIRYGGSFGGLPRVRYWQSWNEPNFSAYLTPQSPDLYRSMTNALSDAVHAVHPDNVVIAGGLSPFGFPGVAEAPLPFMEALLCMSGPPKPKPTCNARIRFDIWADHPYTTGGPTHRARNRGDVSLGDLPRMRLVLDAAIATRHIVSRRPIRFWVTEFSWDSSPPDPVAVPTKLHARWVAEALYRMWSAGVSEVTWFQLRDDPLSASEFQSGLYYYAGPSYASARPKLALEAFRFPFVAYRSAGAVSVWGRTPFGKAGQVAVEQTTGAGWKLVTTLRANRSGIFAAKLFRARATGSLRARIRIGKRSETGVPFSLVRPPDHYYWPFGCGGILPCS